LAVDYAKNGAYIFGLGSGFIVMYFCNVRTGYPHRKLKLTTIE